MEAAHRSGMSVGQWLNQILADSIDEDDADDVAPPPRSGARSRDRRPDTLAERLDRLGRGRTQTAAHRLGTNSADPAMMDLLDGAVRAIERLEARQAALETPVSRGRANPLEAKIDALVEQLAVAPGAREAVRSPRAPVDPAFQQTLHDIELRRRDLERRGAPTVRLGGEALSSHPAAPAPAIDAMREQLEALVGRIDEMRQASRSDGPDIHARLDSLAGRIEEWRNEPRDAIGQIRRDLGQIAGAVEALAPSRLVGQVENAMADVVAKALRAERETLPERLSISIAQIEADLREVLREVGNHRGSEVFGREIARLAERVETLAANANAAAPELRSEIAALRSEVGQAGRAQPLEGLTLQIARLGEEIERFRQSPGSGATEVAAALADVRERMERLDPANAFRGFEKKLDDLSRGMDQLRAQITPMPQLESISERLERIDRVLGKGGGKAFSGLDQLSEKLDRFGERLDGAQSATTDRLSVLLEELTAKMEAASAPSAEPAALDALQTEIGKISRRLENASGGDLSGLERAVTDLFTQLDLARKDMAGLAERAAQEAVKAYARDESTDTLAAEGLLLLKRDLGDFKQAQTDSERRTRQALEALQGTLESMVARLSELDSPRLAAAGVASIEPSRAAPATPAPKPAAAAASPAPGAPRAAAPTPPRAESTPRRIDPTLDLPLEPGERPGDDSDIATPPAAAMNDPRSSFIEAARRAARAASTVAPDPAESKSGRSWFKRKKDKAADAPAEAPPLAGARRPELAVGAANTPSLAARLRKPVLLALAAFIFTVGALKVVSQRQAALDEMPAAQSEPAPLTPPPLLSPPNLPGNEAPRGEGSAAPTAEPGPRTTGSIPAIDPSVLTGGKRSQRLGEAPVSVQADPLTVGSIQSDGAARPIERGGPAIRQLLAESKIGEADRVRLSALEGNPSAMFEIGSRHADGRGLPRDPALAARWFEQSAATGHAPSQYRLASLYREGKGVMKDATIAFQWFDRAAAQGHVLAMHNAAVLLAEGVHGAPDYAGAALWFRRAAEHGVKDSQFNVAILFARGLGVNQDLTEAYRWFSIAANQGDADAAKKRDDIAARLTKDQLKQEKDRIKAFVPTRPVASANEPGNWQNVATRNVLTAPNATRRVP